MKPLLTLTRTINAVFPGNSPGVGETKLTHRRDGIEMQIDDLTILRNWSNLKETCGLHT